MMELRQLSTFRTSAHTLSFSRAAASLNYAQSTVSAQIQGLEEELGVALFDRLGKQVALTDAGQRFLDYVEKILDLADEARSAITNEEITGGTLVISAAETLCTYRLPAVLREFRARYPQVQINLQLIHDPGLQQNLHDGVIDVGFDISEPFEAPNLVVESLITEPLLILAYPEHPLTASAAVTFVDLQEEPLILTESTCRYRRMFLRALKTAGVQPTTLMEFHSIEAIKQSVMAGIGLTLLPLVVVEKEIAQGKLVPLNWVGRDFEVVTQMMWHKDKWLSPALRAFLEVVREVMGEEMQQRIEI
jgi:DNA-binding transcriptional LysR family regulator